MADTVLVSGGDVIEVQLTSETVVIDTPHGRRPVAEPGHIQNRMRLFVREAEGREQKFDFEETELGVRETQRVAIVRANIKGRPTPMNLILFNMSSGEKDLFEQGLRAHLGYTPFFGARWKAFTYSLGVAIVFWLVSTLQFRTGPVWAFFFAAMFAFLLFPLFWWICGLWDRITERARYKRVRAQFIADMESRVRAYAPTAAAANAPSPNG